MVMGPEQKLNLVSHLSREFLTHMETTPLPVKGWKFKHSWPLSSMCSFKCHIYCKIRHSFLKSFWFWPSCSWGEDILTSFIYFHYLSIISSLEKARTFIWTSFTQRCVVLSLVEIGPVVLEKIFTDNVFIFSIFCFYIPLKKSMTFHLNKL